MGVEFLHFTYLCKQFLSPQTLWVQILLRRGVLNITLCDKNCQWFGVGRWFSLGSPVSPTNQSDRHDIAESGVPGGIAISVFLIANLQKYRDDYLHRK
jgi:hypothetical protein